MPKHFPVYLATKSDEIYIICCLTNNERLVATFEYLTECHVIVTPCLSQQTSTPFNFLSHDISFHSKFQFAVKVKLFDTEC